MHTYAHICAEARGENISGLLWRHIAKRWLHLEVWWDDIKINFFAFYLPPLFPVLPVFNNSTFIKKKDKIKKHATCRRMWLHGRGCNIQAQRCMQSGHFALKIWRFERDQSWRRLCCRWAETNPPQVSVCHLSAVALEELHRQFLLSNVVRPTNHKTPASCTNTTTEAEFYRISSRAQISFCVHERPYLCHFFVSFFTELPMQRPKD